MVVSGLLDRSDREIVRDTRRNKRNEDERRAGRERKGNRERDEARVSRAEKNAKRNGLSQKFPAGPILNTGWRYYAPRSRRKIASCLANSSPRHFPVVNRVEIRNENFSGPRNLRSPNRDLIRPFFFLLRWFEENSKADWHRERFISGRIRRRKYGESDNAWSPTFRDVTTRILASGKRG